MYNVLITGSEGQLGQSFGALEGLAAELDIKLYRTSRSELDITNAEAVCRYLFEHKIYAVVNTAAYTAVDRAESETERAYEINATGAALLAECCARNDSWMVQISTDYVFDGRSDAAYQEDSAVAPLNVYGKSKLLGEEAVFTNLPDAVVLRTSWVFSEFGQNFMKTMLRLAGERDTLGIISDQHGAPTYAPHIAEVVLRLIKRKISGDNTVSGVFHFTGEPATTWYGFAQSIFEQASGHAQEFRAPELNAISTENYPTAAERPKNTILGMKRLERLSIPLNNSWQSGIHQALTDLY